MRPEINKRTEITQFIYHTFFTIDSQKFQQIILPIAGDPESPVAGQLCEGEATPTTDQGKQQSDGKVGRSKNTPHDRKTGLVHRKLHCKNRNMHIKIYLLLPIPNLRGNQYHLHVHYFNINRITNITYTTTITRKTHIYHYHNNISHALLINFIHYIS